MMSNEIRVVFPKLYPLQQSFKDDNTRFKVLCAGRRWGKTELLTVIICEAVIAGKNVAYYSMNYKQMWDTFTKILERLKPIVTEQNRAQYSLRALTRGRLTCWSGEASTATRGAGYDLFIVDEGSYIPDLYHKFTSDILPTLAGRAGKAIICSTPKGFNDFYRLFQLENHEPNWKSFQYPTSTNAHITADELRQFQNILSPLQYREEFEAEFVSSEGAVFRNITENLVKSALPVVGHKYVMGVDWGKSNDFTAISVWDTTTMSEVHLDRFNQISWELQRARLTKLATEYGVVKVLAESNSIGEPQIEQLQSEGLPIEGFATTAQSKPKIIQALALALEKNTIKLTDDIIGAQELASYTMTQSAGGGWKYSAPTGGHDDTVIARAIGLYACSDVSTKVTISKINPFRRS